MSEVTSCDALTEHPLTVTDNVESTVDTAKESTNTDLSTTSPADVDATSSKQQATTDVNVDTQVTHLHCR